MTASSSAHGREPEDAGLRPPDKRRSPAQTQDNFHNKKAIFPNIVSYRSSADEADTYSDFGMIWHVWDETTGRVRLAYQRWDIRNQGELQSDGEDTYSVTVTVSTI